MEEKKFNIRVYGLLINEQQEVLLSNEQKGDFKFTKFPGGGLIWGEGTIDCLKREFKEELNLDIEGVKHFFTTDFFQRSAFSQADQLLSIYYLVDAPQAATVYNLQVGLDEELQTFYWQSIKDLKVNDLTFLIDQRVAKLLKGIINSSD